jgi:hypothetical protein
VFIAFTVVVVSVRKLGAADPTAWATVAAALAVAAAVASAWTSQRVLELQEDAQEPNPVALFDFRSRYQLAQFRITNRGGTAAHDVKISWERPLCDSEGKTVMLGCDAPIPVIPQGESASVLMGSSVAYMRVHTDTNFKGTLSFANASGRRFVRSFVVSAEHERRSLVHDQEDPKTQFELQRIPEELQRVAQEIAALGTIIKQSNRTTPTDNDLYPASGGSHDLDQLIKSAQEGLEKTQCSDGHKS